MFLINWILGRHFKQRGLISYSQPLRFLGFYTKSCRFFLPAHLFLTRLNLELMFYPGFFNKNKKKTEKMCRVQQKKIVKNAALPSLQAPTKRPNYRTFRNNKCVIRNSKHQINITAV